MSPHWGVGSDSMGENEKMLLVTLVVKSFWRGHRPLCSPSQWEQILSKRRLAKRRKSFIPICRYLKVFADTTVVVIITRHSILCQYHWRFLWCHPWLSQPLSLRQLPGFPAKLSSLFRSLGGAGEGRAGVWQPAPGSVHTLFYALSHSYTSQILSCVSGKGAVTGAGCQYLMREWFRQRIWCLVEAMMLKDV